MSEKLGNTNKELAEIVKPAIDAAKDAGRDVYGSHYVNSTNTQIAGEFGDRILVRTNQFGEGRPTRIDAHTVKERPDGGKTTFHAYRDESGPETVERTRIVRTNKEGEVTLERSTKNDWVVAAVAEAATRKVIKLADREKERQKAA